MEFAESFKSKFEIGQTVRQAVFFANYVPSNQKKI